jgi:hypothetical protein
MAGDRGAPGDRPEPAGGGAERGVLVVGQLDRRPVKSAARSEFLDAVLRTANGDAVFTPRLAALVLDEFRRLSAEPAGQGQWRTTAIRTRNRHPSDGRHWHVLQADRHE